MPRNWATVSRSNRQGPRADAAIDRRGIRPGSPSATHRHQSSGASSALPMLMPRSDRALAREAFESALAISRPGAGRCDSAGGHRRPGRGWGGEADRAIEWGERGIRQSPFDPWITAALHGMCMGHFLRGRYEEAAIAVRRAIRSKPGFSISYMFLAAVLAKLGRMDEAKAAAERCTAASAELQ